MKSSRISRLYRVPTRSRFFHFVAIQQLFAPARSPPGREPKEPNLPVFGINGCDNGSRVDCQALRERERGVNHASYQI
jgi:hypothetical protein